MGKLVEVIGLVTVIVALLYFGIAKTAFHEITVAILWCGGWMMFAAGMVVRRLERLIDVAPANRA